MNDPTLTWASENDFRSVQRKCFETIPKVQWLHNIEYDDNTTLADAVKFIKLNQDGGLDGILKLTPTTSCFHSWMDFAFIITVAYNRTHNPALFTILRIGSTVAIHNLPAVALNIACQTNKNPLFFFSINADLLLALDQYCLRIFFM